jgi:hypothetical protein
MDRSSFPAIFEAAPKQLCDYVFESPILLGGSHLDFPHQFIR